MINFWQRILTGSIFVGIIIGSILYNAISFQIIFFIIALLALFEFYRIVKNEFVIPNRIFGLFAGAITYSIVVFESSGILSIKWLSLIFPAYTIILFAELYRKNEKPFNNIAYTLLGIIYVILPFALLNKISYHNGNYDSGVLVGYFILLWCSDSFAYVFGNLFGKHRLFERISPKKSWEGSLGGGLCTLAAARILWQYNPQLSLQQWIIMSIIIVVCGTFGDLTESMLKRSLHVKDSGNILPGHGGLLDRFDGLLLSVPFVWAYLELFP